MNPISNIVDILRSLGEERYGRENVSQLAHALQCAALAETEKASPALITASLLHDIGHLVDKRYEDGQVKDIDRHHEEIGAGYLSQWFGEDVTIPIRLHVPAKRYLCAIDDAYFDDLSEASVRSLELQGGPFSKEDANKFIAQPYAEDAVRLRRWDDLGKVPLKETPGLDHYRTYMEQVYLGAAA